MSIKHSVLDVSRYLPRQVESIPSFSWLAACRRWKDFRVSGGWSVTTGYPASGLLLYLCLYVVGQVEFLVSGDPWNGMMPAIQLNIKERWLEYCFLEKATVGHLAGVNVTYCGIALEQCARHDRLTWDRGVKNLPLMHEWADIRSMPHLPNAQKLCEEQGAPLHLAGWFKKIVRKGKSSMLLGMGPTYSG